MVLFLETSSDTETFVQLIAQSKREKILEKITEALFKIQGGYFCNSY